MGVMDIGASALRAAQTRMQTTAHNISNASTPGFSRQEVIVSAREGEVAGRGFVGGGVVVKTVERQYDQFLARELQAAGSALAQDQTRAESLARLDRLFADTESGISARYSAFNAGLADMVNQPFDEAARAVSLQRASELAKSISSGDAEIERMGEDVMRQANDAATQVNIQMKELAALNGRIAGMAGSIHPPNDLLDQRDSLITSINQATKVAAHINDNNTVSLFSSSGDALVVADEASTFSIGFDSRDPGRIRLSLETEGRNLPIPDDEIGGGVISGLVKFHNEDLRDASSRLGQMAGALYEGYNRQQAEGLDFDGQPGQPLFTIGTALARGATDNTGSAVISIALDDGRALKASDYNLQLNGGQLELTRLSDGQVTTLGGLPQTVDGITITLDSGAMAEGDMFSIQSGSSLADGFGLAMRSPAQWANAIPAIPVTGEGNRGSLEVAAFEIDTLGPDTTTPVTLTFMGPNTFDVTGGGTGNPTGVAYTPGQPVTFNGWSVEMAGTPQPGDTLTIKPTADPAADNRNARALLALSEDGLVDGRSLNDAVSGLVGDIGTRTQAANNLAEQSDLWHASAQATRDSVSGVNLDEEAARLLQYQQAYQAAARVISTANTMFDALLSIGR